MDTMSPYSSAVARSHESGLDAEPERVAQAVDARRTLGAASRGLGRGHRAAGVACGAPDVLPRARAPRSRWISTSRLRREPADVVRQPPPTPRDTLRIPEPRGVLPQARRRGIRRILVASAIRHRWVRTTAPGGARARRQNVPEQPAPAPSREHDTRAPDPLLAGAGALLAPEVVEDACPDRAEPGADEADDLDVARGVVLGERSAAARLRAAAVALRGVVHAGALVGPDDAAAPREQQRAPGDGGPEDRGLDPESLVGGRGGGGFASATSTLGGPKVSVRSPAVRSSERVIAGSPSGVTSMS